MNHWIEALDEPAAHQPAESLHFVIYWRQFDPARGERKTNYYLMTQNNDLLSLLERIAVALERLAGSADLHGSSDANGRMEARMEPALAAALAQASLNGDEETEEDEDLDEIESFLASRNVKIKVIPPEDAADEVINSLSEFLGEHYGALKELLAKIKSNMQRGGFINLSIKDYTQKDISDICQFCTRLHEIAFLEQYKYYKSPQYLIKAKTTTLPTAQNFFSGKWLERYVLLVVQDVVNTLGAELGRELDFTYLINPQIVLPNGNDFELDLIFHINGSFYWIEAKTGDYQQHINKYSKISRLFGLDQEHSIMVLTDIPVEKSGALTSLFSMRVYGLQQLRTGLLETVRRDLAAQ